MAEFPESPEFPGMRPLTGGKGLAQQFPTKLDGTVVDRELPTYHQEEITGRTVYGYLRTVRLDDEGRVEISPLSQIGLNAYIVALLGEMLAELKAIRVGIALNAGLDPEDLEDP